MNNIRFEFVGGPLDGRVFRGSLGESCAAERFYLFSNRGSVGQRFKVASTYAIETLAAQQFDPNQEDPDQIDALQTGEQTFDSESSTAARQRADGEPLPTFQRHVYVVIDRVAEGGVVSVRAEYVPP